MRRRPGRCNRLRQHLKQRRDEVIRKRGPKMNAAQRFRSRDVLDVADDRVVEDDVDTRGPHTIDLRGGVIDAVSEIHHGRRSRPIRRAALRYKPIESLARGKPRDKTAQVPMSFSHS